ncbi:MAG: hypothetical protein WAX07_01790 [Candidatus Altiarchaeia archaeon]
MKIRIIAILISLIFSLNSFAFIENEDSMGYVFLGCNSCYYSNNCRNCPLFSYFGAIPCCQHGENTWNTHRLYTFNNTYYSDCLMTLKNNGIHDQCNGYVQGGVTFYLFDQYNNLIANISQGNTYSWDCDAYVQDNSLSFYFSIYPDMSTECDLVNYSHFSIVNSFTSDINISYLSVQSELICPNYYSDVWKYTPYVRKELRWTFYDDCNESEYCDVQSSSCESISTDYSLTIEDADPQARVFKQPGDYVTVVFHSDQTQSVEYSTIGLASESETCVDGQADLSIGETRCKFSILGDATYAILTSGNKSANIHLTTNPDTIYVTDRNALYQRYAGDEGNVTAVLRQLYAKADERQAPVYYLDDYLTGRPWGAYSAYSETPLNPSLSVNTYAMVASSFTKNKCRSCSSVVLVGDDYVVPQYRADYNSFSDELFGNWFNKNSETSSIYTDQPYIPQKKYTATDAYDIFMGGFDPGKDYVVIVQPDDFEFPGLVDDLETTLMGGMYNIPGNRIIEKDSSDVGCNSYSDLEEKTLILIGDRSNNNAIKCTPWFGDVGDPTWDGAMYFERNQWGGDDYAVILSGPKTNRTIETFIDYLENPLAYKNVTDGREAVYIHEFSTPSGLDSTADYVDGFVLGRCESLGGSNQGSCMVSDFTASVTPYIGVATDARDAVLYCFAGHDDSVSDGLICWSSAGGTASSIGVSSIIGIPVAGPTDVLLAGVKRVAKVTRQVLKGNGDRLLKIINKNDNALGTLEGFKKFFGNDVESASKQFASIVEKHQIGVRSIMATFSDDALEANIKNADNIENAAQGAEMFMASGGKLTDRIDNLMPDIDEITRLKTLVDNGKIAKLNSKKISSELSSRYIITPGINTGLDYSKVKNLNFEKAVKNEDSWTGKVLSDLDYDDDAFYLIQAVPSNGDIRAYFSALPLEDVKAMTAEQYADLFALNYIPQNINVIRVPKNEISQIKIGGTAPKFNRPGGGVQIYIETNAPDKLIPSTWRATTNEIKFS